MSTLYDTARVAPAWAVETEMSGRSSNTAETSRDPKVSWEAPAGTVGGGRGTIGVSDGRASGDGFGVGSGTGVGAAGTGLGVAGASGGRVCRVGC